MADLDPTPLREPLAPVSTRDNRRPIAAVLAAGLVVLAIAVPKPWASPAPSTTVPIPPSGSAAVAAGSGATSPPDGAGSLVPGGTPDSYAPLRTICGSPGGWRAATLHRWPNRTAPIRTWSAIEPGEASGADDPDLPYVDVVAAVTALGYCSPRDPSGAPDDTTAEIWAVAGAAGAPERLDARLSEPDAPHPLGGLWSPPAEARAELLGVAAWRPGRYAIRLRGTAFDRWIGIELREPPGPEERATPRPSASPAPS